jgi:hypothetical protein
MPQTKGGLVPAQLINLSTNEKVHFMFNPKEYTISKSNTWERKAVRGRNTPVVKFKQGGSQTLKLQIFFDTYAEGTDVRNHTDAIWKMMAIDETEEDSDSGKSAPPMVAFQWGRLHFKAVIKTMSQKFTMFLKNGTPVRTTVDLTLEQLIDVDDYRPQPGGGSAANTTVVQSQQGQRLDNVAANQTGDASNYRDVADANNIDNPKKVPSGTSLTIPK